MKVAFFAEHVSLQKEAERLAHQFQLPCLSSEKNAVSQGYDALLKVTEAHLELVLVKEKKFKPIWIDFVAGKLVSRSYALRSRHELLAKAIGIKKIRPLSKLAAESEVRGDAEHRTGVYTPVHEDSSTASTKQFASAVEFGKRSNEILSVIDVTAGWGRDAFLLASVGCCVVMVERSPTMAALLQDALNRLYKTEAMKPEQFSLKIGEAKLILNELTVLPDVIYLDPMYPERTKTALVKKEMQILHQLVREDPKVNSLFLLALTKAKKRVVVKRPLHAEYLNHKKPDCQFIGTHTRFDVYFPRSYTAC